MVLLPSQADRLRRVSYVHGVMFLRWFQVKHFWELLFYSRRKLAWKRSLLWLRLCFWAKKVISRRCYVHSDTESASNWYRVSPQQERISSIWLLVREVGLMNLGVRTKAAGFSLSIVYSIMNLINLNLVITITPNYRVPQIRLIFM